MSVFIKFIVWFKLLVDLSSVLSYTVILKPVKPIYSPVKVFRYELRPSKFPAEIGSQYFYHKPVSGQKLYPVLAKPQRDPRTKVSGVKEKKKFPLKGSLTTEKPVLRDHRLYGLPQQLVPPLSNQIEEYSTEGKEVEDENEVRPLAPLPPLEKSFASFGHDKNNIYKPGDWATPPPGSHLENTTESIFTPSQLYLQIRHKNTVIHVPQSEALKDADTLEELINAPRLKELARTTHVQEVYSEEGYEDAGYDHAGRIRHAQHGEVYDAKDEGKFSIKEPPVILDYDSDLEESQSVKNTNAGKNNIAADENEKKPEPRITRSRTETNESSVEFAEIPQHYKEIQTFSSKAKTPLNTPKQFSVPYNSTEIVQSPPPRPTFTSYFGEMPPPPENIFSNETFFPTNTTGKLSAKYRKGELNSTKIYPVPVAAITNDREFVNFQPHLSYIDSQASPSAKSLKYSRIYSKKTKQLRLKPYKTGKIYEMPHEEEEELKPPPPPPPTPSLFSVPKDRPVEEDINNQRIVLPTIGYINSLTTAHFGKETQKSALEEPKPQLTTTLNLTQALNFLRSQKSQQQSDPQPTEPPTESDLRTFEPMKLKKSRPIFSGKTKRNVYIISDRDKRESFEDVEGNDENDRPHDEKNEEIAQDEKKRTEEENREKEQYEKELREEISNNEKEIFSETFKTLGVEKDISEAFPEFPSDSSEEEEETDASESTTTEASIDLNKYPFYKSKRLPENSALRYATDPKKFPIKSGRGMEFYESRESYIQCPDFHPDLEDLPSSNSTEYSESQAGENLRLTGLGDKILCLRKKYFDIEPFDNPIFKEKEIDYVGKPKKLTKNFLKPSQSKKAPNTFSDAKPQSSNNHKKETIKNSGYSIKINYRPRLNYNSEQSTKSKLLPETATHSSPTKTSEENLRQKIKSAVMEISNEPILDKSSRNNMEIVNFDQSSKTRKIDPPKHHSQPQTLPSVPSNQILIPHNCIHNITQLAAFHRNKNIIVECNDAVLIKEVKNGTANLRIVSKQAGNSEKPHKFSNEKSSQDKFYDQTDWIPIVGYPRTIKSPSLMSASRKTDEIIDRKNKTIANSSSDHYVIDELKEDEKVRKGEVVDDMDHYLKLVNRITTELPETTTVEEQSLKKNNATRERRDVRDSLQKKRFTKRASTALYEKLDIEVIRKIAESLKTSTENIKAVEDTSNRIPVSRPFETKRTLSRLSGRDFLTRYHKNKSKPTKTVDFWKIGNSDQVSKKNSSKSEVNKPTKSPLIENSTPRREIKESNKNETFSEKIPSRSESKQTSEFRRISSLNLVPEKITKKPAARQLSEFRRTPAVDVGSTTNSPEIQNFTKIITKVSKEISESSETPRKVYKKIETTTVKPESGERKSETLTYKTINRNSKKSKKQRKEEIEEPNDRYVGTSDGPVLYYVVDARTGRGKWITHYEERRKGSRKLRKTRKLTGGKKQKS